MLYAQNPILSTTSFRETVLFGLRACVPRGRSAATPVVCLFRMRLVSDQCELGQNKATDCSHVRNDDVVANYSCFVFSIFSDSENYDLLFKLYRTHNHFDFILQFPFPSFDLTVVQTLRLF